MKNMTLENSQSYEFDVRSIPVEECEAEISSLELNEVAKYYRELCQFILDKDYEQESFDAFVGDMPAILRKEYDDSFDVHVVFVTDPHYLELESVYTIAGQYEEIHGTGSHAHLKEDMLATPENLQTVLCFSSVVKEARAREAFQASFDW